MYDCCYQGLETLLQKDASSSISLISDGAECLFVSKKLFLEHANAKVLRVVSDLVSQVIIISHIAAESVRQLSHSANISGSKIWAFLEILNSLASNYLAFVNYLLLGILGRDNYQIL